MKIPVYKRFMAGFLAIMAINAPILASEGTETFTDHFVLVSLIGGIVTIVGAWLHFSITGMLKRFERTLTDIDNQMKHMNNSVVRLQTLHPEGTSVGHQLAPHQLRTL